MPVLPVEAFPFCGPSYAHNESPIFDFQRSLNLYPEPGGPSSKSPMMLVGTPGLLLYTTLATAPVRELWAGNNRLFAVGGTTFYEITSGATSYGAMVGSAGTGPCQIVQGAGPSFQLLVMDSSNGKIYNANAGGPSMDAVFDGIALEYLDGFFVAIAKPASGVQNQLNCSAAGDGTSWPALNFARRVSAQDKLTQLAVMNRQLWVFGERTIEVWYNAGNPGFPFAPIQGAMLNIGLLAPFTVAKALNSLLWLGADDRGHAVVYQSQGISARRVSTFALESILKLLPDAQQARAFTYQEEGHTFYVLNFTTANLTMVYDLTTGLWHDRGYGTSALAALPRIRQDCAASVQLSGGNITRVYVGDYQNGKVYQQALSYASDDGTIIRRVRVTPHVSRQNRWTKYPMLEVDADVGSAQMTLYISNDGGKNFHTVEAAKGASNNLAVDGFGRFYWRRLGRSRDRVFLLLIDNTTQYIRLIGGYLTALPGIEQ